MTSKKRVNPFVGPRPFVRDENLYGRSRETRQLFYLVTAERIVWLHSPSGAGKTSLLEASLIPRLEKDGFTVLPTIRVNHEFPAHKPDQHVEPQNRYLLSTLMSLDEGLKKEEQHTAEQLSALNLSAYLAAGPKTDELKSNTILIFDQFEEILTVDPLQTTQKIEFFKELGAALRNENLWAVFALREEFLVQMEPYVDWIPTRWSNTFRLELLGDKAVHEVVKKTAVHGGRTFTDGAADYLFRDLAKTKVQQPDGSFVEQQGNHVEPVQLQVVCRRLWDEMIEDDLSIDEEDLKEFGDVNEALGIYYDTSLSRIAGEDQNLNRHIREWFDKQLITSSKIRGQVLKGEGQSGGLANDVIKKLLDTHLVRGEKRAGATWYELSHDRLVEPVNQSNAQWFENKLVPVQRQAESWIEQKKPDTLLLRGYALKEARKWAKVNTSIVRSEENELITKSVKKRNRTYGILGSVCIVLLIIFIAVVHDRQQKLKIALEAMKSQLTSAEYLIDSERYKEVKKILQSEIFNEGTMNIPDSYRETHNLLKWYSELMSGAPETLFDMKPPLYTLSMSPDGQFLVMGGEKGRLLVYDISVGELKDFSHQHSGTIYSTVIDPNNKWFASGGDEKKIVVRSLKRENLGEVLSCWPTPQAVFSLAVSPDGKYLVSGGGDDYYNYSDEQKEPSERVPCRPNPFTNTAIGNQSDKGQPSTPSVLSEPTTSQDDECLGNNQEKYTEKDRFAISFWEIDKALNGSTPLLPEKQLVGHCSSIAHQGGLVFVTTSGGSWLASADEAGVVYLWDWIKGTREKRKLVHEQSIKSIAVFQRKNDFGSDESFLVTTSDDKSIRILTIPRLSTRTLLTGNRERAYSVAFANKNKWLISSGHDGSIRVWDIATKSTVRILEGHLSAVNDIVMSKDGQKLYSIGDDGTLDSWNITSTPHQTTIPFGDSDAPWCVATSVAISPDLQSIVAGCDAGTIALYTQKGKQNQWTRTWKKERKVGSSANEEKIHVGGVTHLDFNNDGTLLATVGQDKYIHILEVDDGKEFQEAIPTFSDYLKTVAFSPKKNLLGAAGADGKIYFFNREGDETYSKAWPAIDAHKGSIASIVFNLEGDLLVSTGIRDQKTTLWNMASSPPSKIRDLYTAQDQLCWATFNPNSTYIAQGGRSRNVELIKIKPEEGAKTSMSSLSHNDTILRIIYTPTGNQIMTVSADATVGFWSSESLQFIFSLRLPAMPFFENPQNMQVRDFDFGCSGGNCIMAVALSNGKMIVYDFKKIFSSSTL